jgi:N-glycosidase YbiA
MIKSFCGAFRFLSNFYPVKIEYEGITFPSVEHAYQAAKTLNVSERKKISELASAGKAKRAGKNLTLRPDWNDVRVEIMRHLVRKKFSYPDMKKLLICTGTEVLIEGNNWGDTFWGIDFRSSLGKNVLGKILMELRKEFAAK